MLVVDEVVVVRIELDVDVEEMELVLEDELEELLELVEVVELLVVDVGACLHNTLLGSLTIVLTALCIRKQRVTPGAQGTMNVTWHGCPHGAGTGWFNGSQSVQLLPTQLSASYIVTPGVGLGSHVSRAGSA